MTCVTCGHDRASHENDDHCLSQGCRCKRYVDIELLKLCDQTAIMFVGHCINPGITKQKKIFDLTAWLMEFAAKVRGG